MKRYYYTEQPLKIFGVPFFEETKRLERLPEEVREAVPSLSFQGRRAPGARLCFRTNSPKIIVTIEYEQLVVDLGISIYQGESCAVFIGERPTSYYAGLVYPKSYEDRSATREFTKSDELEDITIYLPRNPIITNIYIEVEDEAIVLPPTPYRYPKPILYYGSSIVEGGCGMVSNYYSSLISRWLDVDFYNLGFSGNAKAETEIAQYINTIDKSIFVYDYDHNAPTVEYLEETHERFFRIIREHDKNLPIVMMSRPDFRIEREDDVKRREVIRKTYEKAVLQGDKNVYFMDGETFFGDKDRDICTIDTIHPNDLGFYRMAEKLAPVIRKILEEERLSISNG